MYVNYIVCISTKSGLDPAPRISVDKCHSADGVGLPFES